VEAFDLRGCAFDGDGDNNDDARNGDCITVLILFITFAL
jgi:hypothetical protein